MKNELEVIRKGATWQNLYDAFWHIGTCRYATYAQLKKAFKSKTWFGKILTIESKGKPPKIPQLKKMGYINHFDNDVLCLTDKGLECLKIYSDYNTDIIKIPTGSGDKDQIFNAETLTRAIQRPDFFALFYPESDFYLNPKDHQPFLIPDGALLLKKENKMKLVFLEMENKKSDWYNHVEKKRWKYETIAERESTWSEWWRGWCEKLKINHCPVDEFSFTVWCIGEFKPATDWPGWVFKEKIKL